MVKNYESRLVNLYQTQYLANIKRYAKLSAGKMNFATVYVINELTTKLNGVDTTFKKISENESSVRYTKILNYPLFQITERTNEVEFDFEVGFKNLETSLTCRVIPLEIRVNIGDLINFQGIDNEVLYEADDKTVKQDLLSADMQISELRLKTKSNSVSEVESQVTDIYTYLFEQDKFMRKEDLSKIETIILILNSKISTLELNFEKYNGFTDYFSYNRELVDCFANGFDYFSLGKMEAVEQINIDESLLLIDLLNDDLVTISESIDLIFTIEDIISLIKKISKIIKLKIKNNNMEVELL